MVLFKFTAAAIAATRWHRSLGARRSTGLVDRSSRPQSSPTRTARRLRRQVLHLRRTSSVWLPPPSGTSCAAQDSDDSTAVTERPANLFAATSATGPAS
jgi:hypothetical protein